MTTAELNAEFFRQMSYIADDENSMKKVLEFVKNLVSQKTVVKTPILSEGEVPYMTKAEILSDFSEACQDIKLAREGKLQGRPLEDLLNELLYQDLSLF